MIKGFRDFLMRGNVVDLAVAVVIGAAFGAVIAAFSTDFIGGIIGGSAARRTSGTPA
jgi:large conductance mechanosensitive channel